MAIQINITLTKAGVVIPAGSIIKPNTTFPDDIIEREDDGKGAIISKTRIISMGLPHFPSKESFQSSFLQLGTVDQFPSGFGRPITEQEFESLSGPNALLIVEGWLKDWLEGYLGKGTCSIIDPYK